MRRNAPAPHKLRLVVAHDPQVAEDAGAKRDERVRELEAREAAWTGKLDGQDAGKKSRRRKLSDGGARARFYHGVCEAHLARIVRVALKSELFTYAIDERALARARCPRCGSRMDITRCSSLG